MVESGTGREGSENFKYQIYLTNHFILITSLILVGSTLFDLFQGFYIQSLASLLVLFIFVSVYIAIRYGYYIAGRNFLIVSLNIIIFYFDNYFGRDAGVYVYYSAILVGSAFGLASNEGNRKYLLFIMLPVVLYTVTVATDYRLISFQPQLDNIDVYFYGNIFCNLGINLGLVHIITRNNGIYNRRLSEQNKELQLLNNSMDKFIHGVTHDLRSPVSSVLGLINLSKSEEEIQVIRKYNGMMEKSMLKMEEFIRDMLDYVQSERGETTDLSLSFEKLIPEIYERLKFESNTGEIDFSVSVDQGAEFAGDEKRITIILSNLLSNAIRYSDQTKENPFIKVMVQVDENEAEIIVYDNGIGIEEDKVDKIFDMFYRATEHKAGSGLGLYIVHETVHKLRGSIEVDSTWTQGTLFTLKLPNAQSDDSGQIKENVGIESSAYYAEVS